MFPLLGPACFRLLSVLPLVWLTACRNDDDARLPTPAESEMRFGDVSRLGVPFSKDPHVIFFRDRYLLYYSIPPFQGDRPPAQGWGIGVAESEDLVAWTPVGTITPAPGADYEAKGLAAPAALVRDGRVHLFYQTYGNGRRDAICHAVSDDGVTFVRDETNPIFRPTGDWNAGRAIDAEVVQFGDRYRLYYATRDPDMRIQMIGVAEAPLDTDFSRTAWSEPVDEPILAPKYPWEGRCTEGASVLQRGDSLVMFYAGAYNNEPQQIGVATSRDGLVWRRLSNKPFLENGDPGSWNNSESGHPHIFADTDGRTYLFFQGNNDGGATYFLSKVEVIWDRNGPHLAAAPR